MKQPAVPAFRATGELIDLTALRSTDIDFGEMANALSKIARFNGINRGTAYSVGQHSVMGADALYREHGNADLAGYFLLHDGHEYLIGDVTKPTVRLIEHHIVQDIADPKLRKILAGAAKRALDAAKAQIDGIIAVAAGRMPLSKMPIYARQVKQMDERMCAAESAALFGTFDRYQNQENLPPPKLVGAIMPWGACKAEELFLERLERYLGIVVRAVA